MAVTISSPTVITGHQATLNGAGQNVPVTNSMRFEVAANINGPWTVYVSPPVVGNAAANQPIAQVIPVGVLNDNTTYYVRLVEFVTIGGAVVATTGTVTFTTISDGVIDTQCIPPCTVNVATPFPWILPPVLPPAAP